jgi:hypothetical protein
VFIDNGAGGTIIDLEPQEILNLFERSAQQQQWLNREMVRGSGGKYEVDQLALMQAKIDALQIQVDKQKATSKMVQVQACTLCGDEKHDYQACPLAQPEEDMEHVNSLNSEPSFFPKPPFTRSYSIDPNDRQTWRERPNIFGSYNNSINLKNAGQFTGCI